MFHIASLLVSPWVSRCVYGLWFFHRAAQHFAFQLEDVGTGAEGGGIPSGFGKLRGPASKAEGLGES